MGGGYELSNPKGNVPRRQLPSEKWPHLGHKCVRLHADVWEWGGWRIWHGPAGVTQLWTATPPLSYTLTYYTQTHMYIMTDGSYFFSCLFGYGSATNDLSVLEDCRIFAVITHEGEPFFLGGDQFYITLHSFNRQETLYQNNTFWEATFYEPSASGTLL